MNPLPSSKHPSGEPEWKPKSWNSKFGNNVRATHNCYSYMLDDLHEVQRKYGKPQPGWYEALINGKNFNNDHINCKIIQKGVKLDNPHIKVMSIKEGKHFACPPFHYKGLMMVSPDRDFHFARQDDRMTKVYKHMMNHNIRLNSSNTTEQRLKVLTTALQVIPEVFRLLTNSGHQFGNPKKDLRKVFNWSKLWSHKPGATNATDKDADDKLIVDPVKANWNYSNKGGIHYNTLCCFFVIPNNMHLKTYSSGIPDYMSINRSPDSTSVSNNVMKQNEMFEYEKQILKLL